MQNNVIQGKVNFLQKLKKGKEMVCHNRLFLQPRYVPKGSSGLKFKLLVILSFVINSTIAAEFSVNGTMVKSLIKDKVINCSNYSILLRSESFPFDYEMDVPAKFKIKGFNGSRVHISKEAYIKPLQIKVPKPQELAELKKLYPQDLTYLPTNAICKGEQLIISYWAGGNCSNCEAFIQFKLKDNQLINAKKVNYSHVRAMSK